MASCLHCGQIVVWGGVKKNGLTFCGEACCHAERWRHVDVPEYLIRKNAIDMHRANCSHCGGPGPVDVHHAYRVMSFLIFSHYGTLTKFSCGSCATKFKLGALLTTLILGWWGIPWGLLLTPIYLIRNAYALVKPVSPDRPSDALLSLSQRLLAKQMLEQQESANTAG